MALFSSLYEMMDVLRGHVDVAFGSNGITEIGFVPTEPQESASRILLSLLWTTPQPTHRNDPWARDELGALTPPPLTLSVFVLVTSYGSTGQGDEPVMALTNLSRVLELFHSAPSLALPLTVDGAGEGPLTVVQVPTAADLMEKIYSPLQARVRPWVLYEVGPVQLANTASALPPQPVVHPGGVRLLGPEVATPPVIERITPTETGPGMRVRIDVSREAPVDQARIGPATLSAADLTEPVLDGPIFAVLPDTGLTPVPPGIHDVTVRTSPVTSERSSLRVREPDLPALASPDWVTQSITADLELVGQALDGASAVVLWPDAGVLDPNVDVKTLTLHGPGTDATTVTVLSATLAAQNVQPGVLYRATVQIGTHSFVPFVLVEFTS